MLLFNNFQQLDRNLFLIRPVHDFGFKILFGHQNDPDCTLIISFLEALFEEKFQMIEFKDRQITPVQALAKEVRLDLRIRCDDIFCNLEMQMIPTGAEGERIIYYVSLSIQDQIMKGLPYEELTPIRQVFILAEDADQAELGFNEFVFENTVTHTLLTDKVKAYMINLKKVLASITDFHQMTQLQKWCLFLAYGHTPEHEGMKILMEDEIFRKAAEIMKCINNDEELKDIAFERMRREMDHLQRMRTAERRGKEKGEKIGEKRGEKRGEKKGDYARQVKTAIEMIKDNADLSLIAKYTGLTIHQIEEIQHQLHLPEMMIAENQSEHSSLFTK